VRARGDKCTLKVCSGPVAVGADGVAADHGPGKLLTTPTRLLKLILPLPMGVEKEKDNNSNGLDYGRSISANDEIQPLALLIHPQQPLSTLSA
jgi:hypothetical protein